jgi:hypothetical protein
MAENVVWTRKIGEGILMDQNEKNEIKTGKDFWTAENLKYYLNNFYLKILQTYISEILFYYLVA